MKETKLEVLHEETGLTVNRYTKDTNGNWVAEEPDDWVDIREMRRLLPIVTKEKIKIRRNPRG